MKLTAEKLFPIVLTLDLEEKEKLFRMFELNLRKEIIRIKKEISLDRVTQQY
jgi:hypothetical protein